MSQLMQAVVLHGKEDLRVESVAVPQAPVPASCCCRSAQR